MADWPAGVGRIVLAQTDSTMNEAPRQIAAGASVPFWVLALAQSGGRGRRGRAWDMPAGNFAASHVMAPKGPQADWALRSFTASLALYEAFDALTGRADLFTLKWPNDVLCEGRKCAGILLETDGARLTLGIGVNLVAYPEQATLEAGALPATSILEATGRRITPEALLDALAPAFARWEQVLIEDGFAPVRAAWLSRAANIGKPVTARMPGRSVSGLFDGIDTTGAIVIDTGAGRQVLPAADIFFAPS
ncbi:BirA family biotin operon repressor/biotin-[acetyl-CoA-carboxylase] ligase [Rubricella aquisinus]|uniref:biotin--[biotin carboxyl-carrier protein] ligase n=1 Tax=Rubricella aquisinus TaxID=2028108 RepID=A0A840WKT3_9RHOB|nr:biotin--[acetyl-CoA-carboxylase] ligase [Rubricella aquisinus]MBB5515708.1 BirA family biotin operon repressor/biotin-[acetyl-CoA-carboxylase] ligase [Rubricella aquisinus]